MRTLLERSARLSSLALLLAAPAAASVSWRVSGDGLSGPRDYKESTIEAGMSASPEGSSVEALDLSLGRTSYGVRGSTETTVTWSLGGGVTFKNGLGGDLSLWTTPAPRVLGEGSYRAAGVDAAARARWDGPGFLETDVAALVGGAVHEEYFIVALPLRTVRRWFPVGQSYAGAALTERLPWGFRLGAEGRAYRYDKDLPSLSRSLEFLSLFNAGAASTYDLLLGFPKASWGFKAGQSLGSWGDLSASWRRTTYVIGQTSRSDRTSFEAGVSPWRFLTVRLRYELSRPLGGEADEYKGLGLETGF